MPEPKLTPRRRALLRSAARRRRADAAIGKGGAAPAVVVHVGALLDRRELVKVRLAASAGRRQAAADLAEALGAELVDLVGRMAVLYRPNPALPPARRVLAAPPGRPRPGP